jgi:hypothetical protein
MIAKTKDLGTRMLGQDSWKRKVGTGNSGQDSGEGLPEKILRMGQAGQESEDKAART